MRREDGWLDLVLCLVVVVVLFILATSVDGAFQEGGDDWWCDVESFWTGDDSCD
jgi:hypothetical protein